MNANAYGGDLSRVLEWVEVASAAGGRAPHARASSAFATAAPTSGRARWWRGPRSRCSSAEPEGVKATLAEMRAARKAAQPSGIKTFGSTFKNPDDPRAEGRSAGVLLDEAGCRGLTVGGARFSEKHANFVENTGEATTADVVALMAEGGAACASASAWSSSPRCSSWARWTRRRSGAGARVSGAGGRACRRAAAAAPRRCRPCRAAPAGAGCSPLVLLTLAARRRLPVLAARLLAGGGGAR